ncbi:MAG: GNAT family N-acetyltransferase, partial [Thiotrichales bacterium]
MTRLDFAVFDAVWMESESILSAIRTHVFIEEQGVPKELEWDGLDLAARHVVAVTPTGDAIATGRLLADGQIGRMAVLAPYRRHGVGSAILKRLIERARAETALKRVLLHAQIHAVAFYVRHGFEMEG